MPNVRPAAVNVRRPLPAMYGASSDGSICVFACSPSRLPSASNTTQTISRPAVVGRSVPTIVTTPARRTAAAIASRAWSSMPADTSGTSRGWLRWPGTAVSGRQTTCAPRRAASSTAAIAAGTASAMVAVSGVEATAMRTVDMQG